MIIHKADVLFPHLYPLMLLAKPYELVEGEAYPGLFRVRGNGNRIEVLAHECVVPECWEVSNGTAIEDAVAYTVLSGVTDTDEVTITPTKFSFEAQRHFAIRGGMGEQRLQISVSCSPVSRAVFEWVYRDYASRTDVASAIVVYWHQLARRHALAQRLVDTKAPSMIIANQRKLVYESLCSLRRRAKGIVVPDKERCLDIDLGKVKEVLRVELPPALNDALDDDGLISDSQLRTWLRVIADVGSEAITGARLEVVSNDGPSQRPKQGFSFLHQLLEKVPAIARENTGGEMRRVRLDPNLLKIDGLDLVWTAEALTHFAQCFYQLRGPLDQLLYDFQRSGWEEATVVLK